MKVSIKFIIVIVFLMYSIQVAFAQTAANKEYYEEAYMEMADMLEGTYIYPSSSLYGRMGLPCW